MHIIIELCTDGCFEPVHFIGKYDTLAEAQKEMADRISEVTSTYTEWRGFDFDPDYIEDSSNWAGRGYDGEGFVFEWYIFDPDHDCESVIYAH